MRLEPKAALPAVDVLLGVAARSAELTWWALRPARFVARPAVGVLGTLSDAAGVTRRGRELRDDLQDMAVAALQRVATRVVEITLAGLDLTAIVLRHVDLDAVAAALDVDAVAERLSPAAVTALVDGVLARLVPATLATLVEAVLAEVDLDTAVARVDLDAAVARVDIAAVVDRVDLNAVAARLDPDPVVARVDLDAAITRVDVVRIAAEVLDAIDLPSIIRNSTGTLSSEAVRTVRSEGVAADDAVAGFVDRLLRRRRAQVPSVP